MNNNDNVQSLKKMVLYRDEFALAIVLFTVLVDFLWLRFTALPIWPLILLSVSLMVLGVFGYHGFNDRIKKISKLTGVVNRPTPDILSQLAINKYLQEGKNIGSALELLTLRTELEDTRSRLIANIETIGQLKLDFQQKWVELEKRNEESSTLIKLISTNQDNLVAKLDKVTDRSNEYENQLKSLESSIELHQEIVLGTIHDESLDRANFKIDQQFRLNDIADQIQSIQEQLQLHNTRLEKISTSVDSNLSLFGGGLQSALSATDVLGSGLHVLTTRLHRDFGPKYQVWSLTENDEEKDETVSRVSPGIITHVELPRMADGVFQVGKPSSLNSFIKNKKAGRKINAKDIKLVSKVAGRKSKGGSKDAGASRSVK